MMRHAAVILAALLVLGLTAPLPQAAATTPRNGTVACRAGLARCLRDLPSGSRCDPILPVPPESIAPPLRAVGYNLTPLREGVFSYWDGGCFSLILVARRRLVVVDMPDSARSNIPTGSRTRLTAAVEEALDGATPSAIHLVYSHAHFDHIGGAARLARWAAATHPRARVTVWGTASARDLINRSAAPRAVPVTRLVPPTGAVLRVAPRLALSLTVVGGHTEDDLAVHIPPAGPRAPGIVHWVDVVLPGWAPPFTLAITTDVGAFVTAHDAVLRLEWEVFSGGHFTRLGSREDVEVSRAYATDLIEAARSGVAAAAADGALAKAFGRLTTRGTPEFGNVMWAFVNVQRRLEIDACQRTMLRKWGCKLGGVDIVLRDNCFSAITYILVDE